MTDSMTDVVISLKESYPELPQAELEESARNLVAFFEWLIIAEDSQNQRENHEDF